MDELYAKIYAIFVGASSGDARGTLFTQMQDALNNVFNSNFPYNQKAALSVDKAKSDLAVLQKFMSANSIEKGATNESS